MGRSGWFAVGLKAGNTVGVYVFNSGSTVISGFDYTTAGIPNGKHALSHADVYASANGRITSLVPEPSTYAMIGAGLLAVGVAVQRKRSGSHKK